MPEIAPWKLPAAASAYQSETPIDRTPIARERDRSGAATAAIVRKEQHVEP